MIKFIYLVGFLILLPAVTCRRLNEKKLDFNFNKKNQNKKWVSSFNWKKKWESQAANNSTSVVDVANSGLVCGNKTCWVGANCCNETCSNDMCYPEKEEVFDGQSSDTPSDPATPVPSDTASDAPSDENSDGPSDETTKYELAEPKQVQCKNKICPYGQFCCNESCGICAPIGGQCHMLFCQEGFPVPENKKPEWQGVQEQDKKKVMVVDPVPENKKPKWQGVQVPVQDKKKVMVVDQVPENKKTKWQGVQVPVQDKKKVMVVDP